MARVRREELMKKEITGRIFDPERYEMIFCSGCNGSGRTPDDATGTNICRVCGGFGLIRKQEKRPFPEKLVAAKALT